MSLVAGYSSDEDDLGPATITEDAFGLSNLPVSKKPRTEEIVSRQTLQAAPDVLAEVCVHKTPVIYHLLTVILGSFEPNVPYNASHRYTHEC